METGSQIFSVDAVDITDVDKPVDNVEKPSVSGKNNVESPVEKVDKKLHRGCQNNFSVPAYSGQHSRHFAGKAERRRDKIPLLPLVLLLEELHLIMDRFLLVAVECAKRFNHQLFCFGQPYGPFRCIS